MLNKIKILEKVLKKKEGFHDSLTNIYVDNEYMMATDERIMLVIPHFCNVEQQLLIVNHKAKNPVQVEGSWEGLAVNYSIAKEYPDYNRVLNVAKEYTKVETSWSLLDFLYNLSHYTGWLPDYTKYATLFKHLSSKLKEIKEYCYIDNKSPLFIKFEGGEVLVIMPITVFAVNIFIKHNTAI